MTHEILGTFGVQAGECLLERGGNKVAEMEDKFQEILGNEEAMGQIMSLAQSFGGGGGELVSEDRGLEGLMNGLDPKMMSWVMGLVSAYQSGHRSIELMTALRPFVSEERYPWMDRLATATKLARVAATVLDMMGEKGVDHV